MNQGWWQGSHVSILSWTWWWFLSRPSRWIRRRKHFTSGFQLHHWWSCDVGLVVRNNALMVATHSPSKATTKTILVVPNALMINPKLEPKISWAKAIPIMIKATALPFVSLSRSHGLRRRSPASCKCGQVIYSSVSLKHQLHPAQASPFCSLVCIHFNTWMFNTIYGIHAINAKWKTKPWEQGYTCTYIEWFKQNSNINDIHRITCQLKWVWLTPSG